MSASRKNPYPGVPFPTSGYGAPAAPSSAASPISPASSGSYAYPQPGSLAYAATQGPNGVTYQPVVAQSVTYQTPQGPVQAIQYVPATSPPPTSTATSPALAGRPIGAGTTVAGSTYTAGYPPPSHVMTGQRPAAVPMTPPVAYDNKRYGDIIFGRSEKDQNRAMKQWQRDQKESERQSEKRSKERRKEEKEAAKRMEQWDRDMREREKAEEMELRRAREMDRKANERRRRLSDAGAYDPRERDISGRGLDPDLERRLRELQLANDSNRVPRARSRSRVRGGSISGFDDPHRDQEYERRRRMSATYSRDPYFPGPGHPVGSVSANPSPSMGNAALVPASPYRGSQSSSYRSSPYHGPIDRSPGAHHSRPPSIYDDPPYKAGGSASGRNRAASFSHSPRMPMPSPRVDHRAIEPQYDPRVDPRFEPRGGEPPLAFKRPPNAAVAYTPFDAFWIIRDMNQMLESLPLLPPLPAVLVPHDVMHEDWERFMIDIIAAWQGRFPVSKKGRLVRTSRRGYVLSNLIDAWNDNFLLPRGVEMVLYRDRDRFSGPQAAVQPMDESSDESDTSDSDSEDDSEEDRYRGGLGRGIYGVGQTTQEKMQRQALKREKQAERKKREKMRKKADREEEGRVYGLYLGGVNPGGTGGRSPMRGHVGF